jgi:hypothetical protein
MTWAGVTAGTDAALSQNTSTYVPASEVVAAAVAETPAAAGTGAYAARDTAYVNWLAAAEVAAAAQALKDLADLEHAKLTARGAYATVAAADAAGATAGIMTVTTAVGGTTILGSVAVTTQAQRIADALAARAAAGTATGGTAADQVNLAGNAWVKAALPAGVGAVAAVANAAAEKALTHTGAVGA